MREEKHNFFRLLELRYCEKVTKFKKMFHMFDGYRIMGRPTVYYNDKEDGIIIQLNVLCTVFHTIMHDINKHIHQQ